MNEIEGRNGGDSSVHARRAEGKEDSLKTYRALKNSLDTAEEKGREGGRVEEKKAIARKMKSKGFDAAEISEITGLTKDEIKGYSPQYVCGYWQWC